MPDDPSPDRESPIDEVEVVLERILLRLDAGESNVEAELDSLTAAQKAAARRRLERLGALGLAGADPGAMDRIGEFRLIERLGAGGMGEVWRAEQTSIGREVALKTLRAGPAGPLLARRFEREARAMGRIEHDNIVRVHAAGQDQGVQWIAMELVEGRSLQQILAGDGPRPEVRQLVAWAADIARALSALHEAGIVHRDVKPANVQITAEGRPVLIDFGLTRGIGPTSISVEGGFVGSPHYAAPEQIRGEEAGPAADIYGLGITLYEVLSGSTPFAGRTAEQLFHEVLTRDPAPLSRLNPAVPRDLETVVHHAIEKSPSRRYDSAAAFASDLERILALESVRARPPSLGRRMLRAAGRHPLRAAAVLLPVVATLVLVTLQALERNRARRQATELLDRANLILDRHDREQADLPERTRLFEKERSAIDNEYASPERIAAVDREEQAIEHLRAGREARIAEALRLIERARELLPTTAGLDRALARAQLSRWRAARADDDPALAEFLARRVEEILPGSDLARAVRPEVLVTLRTDPPGARVDAFVLATHHDVVADGQPREVLIPHRGLPPGLDPGAIVLRVVASSGEVRMEDLVLAVAGETVSAANHSVLRARAESESGVLLRVHRDGRTFDLPAPPDLVLRPTARAPWHGPESHLGETPLADAAVRGDLVLLIVRRDGHAPLRLLLPGEGRRRFPTEFTLDAADAYPPGFVRAVGRNGKSIRVLDREITSREYLAFLNDVDQHPEGAPTSLLPRTPEPWPRDDVDDVLLPVGLDPETPVLGVSWHAAAAYAAWRTRAAARSGSSYRFFLPDWQAWHRVVRVAPWPFVWGRTFRASYAKTCHARPEIRPEPVLSFPIDENLLGLYDSAGSASELCDGWFWEEHRNRPLHGGNWMLGEPSRFQGDHVFGAVPETAHWSFGFRLAIE